MIWNLIGLVAAGSFFFVGLSIMSDPLCKSVSFQGGGARTIATNCLPDGSGDFSRGAAISLLFVGGTILFAWLFRNYLIRIYRQLRFQYSMQQTSKKIDANSDHVNLEELITLDSKKPTSVLYKNKNVLIALLILVLLIPAYKFIAPRISLLNPITCASLTKELAAKDVLGRELWNSYQVEVSNLSRVEGYSNEYYLQVSNAARRALQLKINDFEGYQMLKEKPHCVKNIKLVAWASDSTATTIKYLSGVGLVDGKKFDVYSGWNTNYYNAYSDFKVYLK